MGLMGAGGDGAWRPLGRELPASVPCPNRPYPDPSTWRATSCRNCLVCCALTRLLCRACCAHQVLDNCHLCATLPSPTCPALPRCPHPPAVPCCALIHPPAVLCCVQVLDEIGIDIATAAPTAKRNAAAKQRQAAAEVDDEAAQKDMDELAGRLANLKA